MTETRERLENDRAALAVALRLAEYGAAACARDKQTTEEREIADLYSDGAGAIEPDALTAWLKAELAAADNSLDALDGAGPPDPEPPAAAVLRQALDDWPEFESDADVSGGDLVEWFANFRDRARVALGDGYPKPAEHDPTPASGPQEGRVYLYLTGSWFAVVGGRLVVSASRDHDGLPDDGWDVWDWTEVVCIEHGEPLDPNGFRFLSAINKAFGTAYRPEQFPGR